MHQEDFISIIEHFIAKTVTFMTYTTRKCNIFSIFQL